MPVTAVVGANWGDEGKGKITDFLAREADFVVRYQGGNNAGHTIINEYGKFALHLLPSGVFSQGVVNVVGPGVALNVPALLGELASLEKARCPPARAEDLREGPGGPALPHPVRRDGRGAPRPRAVRLHARRASPRSTRTST